MLIRRQAVAPLVSAALLLGCNAMISSAANNPDAGREVAAEEAETFHSARIFGMSVSAPMGRFLLARKGSAVCALRFTAFHRDHDKSQPGVFTSGDGHTYAEYDWYFQGDGSGDFSKTNVTSGHGQLRNTPSFGIGRFAFKPSAILHITCGSFRVAWGYPNALQFISYPKSDPKDDYDLELAPTRFSDIRQLDLTNPKLRWYTLNDRLPPTVIPLDQLP